MKELYVQWFSGKEVINLDEINSVFLSIDKNQVQEFQTYEIRKFHSNPFDGRCNYLVNLSFSDSVTASLETFSLEYTNSGIFLDGRPADGVLGKAVFKLSGKNWTCTWTQKDSEYSVAPTCTQKDHLEVRTKSERKFTDRDPMFREIILASDCYQCVLTNEMQEEVLEAAHLFEVRNDGFDSDDNGITLRKDLHALFDARLFTITPEGIIEFDVALSEFYKRTLQDKKLPPMTLARVKKNLTKRFVDDKSWRRDAA